MDEFTCVATNIQHHNLDDLCLTCDRKWILNIYIEREREAIHQGRLPKVDITTSPLRAIKLFING